MTHRSEHEHDHDHGSHHRHGHGHGHGRPHGPRSGRGLWGSGPGWPGEGPGREAWLHRLEEHQRDLEQRAADVAGLIRRLKEERPETTGTTTV